MRKQRLPHWIHLRSRKPVLCDSGRKISAYEDDLTELVEVQNCHILKRDFENKKFEIKLRESLPEFVRLSAHIASHN